MSKIHDRLVILMIVILTIDSDASIGRGTIFTARQHSLLCRALY